MKDLHRGNVASDADNHPVQEVESFVAQIIVLNHPGHISRGYCPVIDVHTAHVACRFDEILNKQEKRTGKIIEENPESIKQGDGALVRFVPTRPLVIEAFNEFPPLGRFAIRDMKKTVGVGIVKEVTKKLKVKSAPPAQH